MAVGAHAAPDRVVDDQQYLRGVRRLLSAVVGETDADEQEPLARLDEGLEAAHLSADGWRDCLEQMERCRTLTRRQLGLRDDGSDGWEDLADGAPTKTTAAGLRTFLRRMSVLIEDVRDISALAAELHAIVYGDDPRGELVTWRDYRTVLEGKDNQPDAWQVRTIAAMLRAGARFDEVTAATGLSRRQVKGVSEFLGLREWRQESKARAARAAVEAGWSPARLSAEYNARADGLDEMQPRTAAAYMDAVHGREGRGWVPKVVGE